MKKDTAGDLPEGVSVRFEDPHCLDEQYKSWHGQCRYVPRVGEEVAIGARTTRRVVRVVSTFVEAPGEFGQESVTVYLGHLNADRPWPKSDNRV